MKNWVGELTTCRRVHAVWKWFCNTAISKRVTFLAFFSAFHRRSDGESNLIPVFTPDSERTALTGSGIKEFSSDRHAAAGWVLHLNESNMRWQTSLALSLRVLEDEERGGWNEDIKLNYGME